MLRTTGHDGFVGRRQAAQAVEFVRALRDQLEEMVLELAWVERQRLNASRGSRVSALRWQAAALRRDINEAQILIDRLQHRYLNAD
ncbi:MAG: hypothetical protein ACXVBB_20845 [Isosphaeraceae bacterium]